MGAERGWKREHLFLYIACCMTILCGTFGCAHVRRVWQPEERVAKARELMLQGAYEAALDESNRVLRLYSDSWGDEALYIMGLIYMHPRNPNQDYGTSLKFFQRLKHEFPESPLRDDAEAWIAVIQTVADKNEEIGTLQHELVQAKETIEEKNRRGGVLESEVEELKGQIEGLKKVDLGIDEKKRGVSPPSRGDDGERD